MLNDKIEEAKRKKNVLIARKKRAEAQKAIQETMSGLRDQSAFETFDRMSQKIDQIEAEAEAQSELAEEYSGDTLASQFSQLEKTHSADEDLSPSSARWACYRPRRPRRRPSRCRRASRLAPATAQNEQDELAAALEEMEVEQQQQEKMKAGR
jgi:phage shock protein A